jgi:microcystin-dependent protein
VFDTLAHLDGKVIAFTPHTTNGATVTLNVDGLGAKPLRSAPSTELLAGTIIQGTPYLATYNNSDSAFYLQGFYGNPYNVPLGAGLPFFLNTAPNSSFVFPFGQAISRTTYSTLFSSMSTTFGNGDGSTTFNLPDLRGRVPAGADAMGGSAASRLTSANISGGAANGNAGGSETVTLVTANLPPYTPSGTVSSALGGSFTKGLSLGGSPVQYGGTGTGATPGDISVTSTFTGTAQGGTSSAVLNVQPTLVCNYIIRII